jgi:hypothetical protein
MGGIASGQSIKGVIERDLHRTFPRHILFAGSEEVQKSDAVKDTVDDVESNCDEETQGKRTSLSTADTQNQDNDINHLEGPAALRRLLYAYNVYDEEVGYCQGMNFIAAMFLTFLPEEEAFWMFVAVMNEEPYEMRELFLENMAGTHKSLFVADKLIQKLLPKLAYHFKRESIHISMFATQWVMTIFASTFPFDLVARVWDSFIVEGWKVVYRITLALLDYATPELLELSIEEVFDYFREFPQKIDGQAIINASLNIPLKNKLIRKYTDEWNKVQNRGNDIFHRKVSSDSNASSASGTRIIQRSKVIAKKMRASFRQNRRLSL